MGEIPVLCHSQPDCGFSWGRRLKLTLSKGGHNFSHHATILSAIARRKVERFDPTCACGAGQASSGICGQMCTFRGKVRICLGKGSFDEKQIGIVGKCNNGSAVGRRIRSIGHIGDLLSAHYGDGLAQNAKRYFLRRWCCSRLDYFIIRPLFQHRTLQVSQPRSNGKSKLFEAILPNIDMCRFFDGESQTGRTVFKHRSRDTESRFMTKDSTDESRRAQVFEGEGSFQTKLGFLSVKRS